MQRDGAFAARGWRGEMMRVGGVAVAGQLGINSRAARFGVLQFFQHQHARAFAHDEAVALLVEGPRGAFGIIIARAHGFHGAEAADADGNDGRLGPAGEHDLRVAHFNGAPGLADGVIGGGAGRAGREIRSAQIVIHRNQSRCHVRNEHRDHEGRKPARAAVEQNLHLLAGRLQAADAGADEHAHLVAVRLVQVQRPNPSAPARRRERRIAKSGPCAGFPLAKETPGRGSKSLTSAAICVSNGDASNETILSTPHWPAIRFFQNASHRWAQRA